MTDDELKKEITKWINLANTNSACQGSGSWTTNKSWESGWGDLTGHKAWKKFDDAFSKWDKIKQIDEAKMKEYQILLDTLQKEAEEAAMTAPSKWGHGKYVTISSPKEFMIIGGTKVLVLKSNLAGGVITNVEFFEETTDRTVKFEMNDLVYGTALAANPNEYDFRGYETKSPVYIFRLPENKVGWTLLAVEATQVFIR